MICCVFSTIGYSNVVWRLASLYVGPPIALTIGPSLWILGSPQSLGGQLLADKISCSSFPSNSVNLSSFATRFFICGVVFCLHVLQELSL